MSKFRLDSYFVNVRLRNKASTIVMTRIRCASVTLRSSSPANVVKTISTVSEAKRIPSLGQGLLPAGQSRPGSRQRELTERGPKKSQSGLARRVQSHSEGSVLMI